MAAPSYDQNGLIFQRRLSRAYDQPIVEQHSTKGTVVRTDMDKRQGSPDPNADDGGHSSLEALGGMVAKITVGLMTVVGVLVGLLGKASLDVISFLFGLMVLMVISFFACTGTFYWWASINISKVGLTVEKVIHIYLICVLSDLLACLVGIFTAVPPTSSLPVDTGYFIILATLLFFVFSLLVHKDGLNAMFSQETAIFVACTMVLNFSSTCLFRDVLPRFLLPQLVYVGALLGLSVALAGYKFPKVSLSGIYWTFNQPMSTGPARPVVNIERSSVHSSVDNSPQSRRCSYSSTSVSSLRPLSVSSANSSMYPHGMDSEVASEARGLLTELLFHKDSLSNDMHLKLRRIKEILSPRPERVSSRVRVGNQIDHDDHDYESDISSNTSSMITSLVNKNHGKVRSRSVHLRPTTTNFAVATSDTGMPVLETEPKDRTRSLALRDVKARISVQEKRHSVHRMGRDRLGVNSPRLGVNRSSNLSSLSHSSLSATGSESDLSVAESLEEESDIGRQPVATPPQQRRISKLGTSLEDGQNLAIIKEGTELQVEEERPRSSTLPGNAKFSVFATEEANEERLYDQKQMGEHKFYSFTKYRRPSESCDLSEYTSNEHLDMFENVAVWDYPIFELEEKAGNHILSHMAHMLFHEAGLMETFKIPQREFVNYFRALEANYGNNVYHNKTHAADVLHAVSYLLFEIIPEFSHEFSYEDSQREWKGYSRIKGSGGNIASAFSILEVLAGYLGSAMHDFDHPGRTNAFLVGTKSPLAVLYNDRSVLENHHAAASWHLLTHFDENNFLTSLEGTELKRLRFLIIEAILATDLKMHFDILAMFRAKVSTEEGGGIDWDSEVDRMLVMKMLIKMADINTPTKSFDLHRTWTSRITEEFYQQSEEELTLGLPPTIFMDRRYPEKLPAVQLSFIQHLVSPLFQVCAEAGIIPGISESRGNSTTPGPDETGVASEGVDDILESASEEGRDPKFMSIILTNLQINYEGWKAELPEDKEEEEEEEERVEDKKENENSVESELATENEQ